MLCFKLGLSLRVGVGLRVHSFSTNLFPSAVSLSSAECRVGMLEFKSWNCAFSMEEVGVSTEGIVGAWQKA